MTHTSTVAIQPFSAPTSVLTRTAHSIQNMLSSKHTPWLCFRPPDEGPSEYQTIPLSKIEDFGVHAKQYYSLDITFFKSSTDAHMLDLLWNKYAFWKEIKKRIKKGAHFICANKQNNPNLGLYTAMCHVIGSAFDPCFGPLYLGFGVWTTVLDLDLLWTVVHSCYCIGF